MSLRLITLEQAKDHLRQSHIDDDDTQILEFIEVASNAIALYMKRYMDAYLMTNGEAPPILDGSGQVVDYDVPPVMKGACKIYVGELFKNREAEQDGEIGGVLGIPHGYGYLPRPVVALLFPLRDPALA